MSARQSILKKLADGRYQARVWDENREPAPGYTSKRFGGRAEAVRWIKDTEASLARGLRTGNHHKRATVLDVCAAYLALKAPVWADNTAERKAREVRLYVKPYSIARKPVADVRPSDVDRWLNELRALELSPGTVNLALGTLRSALDMAARDGVTAGNPARLVERARAERTEAGPIVAMALSTYDAIVDALRPWLRIAAVLSLALGLRAGEVLGLTLDRVNFLRHEVTVDRQMSRRGAFAPCKHGSARVVPVDDATLAAINAHVATYGLGTDGLIVHGATGGRLWSQNWNEQFQDAVVRAGYERGSWVPHDLRHAFGSYQLAAGHRETRVAKWMGHTNLATFLKVYAHDLEVADAPTPIADLRRIAR